MAHQITVSASGDRFACAEDMNVLAAMERARCQAIPVGCRNGGCGACKVRVTAGQFHTAKMNRAVVSEQEQQEGCVLACKLFPRQDLSLQVLGRVWQPAAQKHPSSFSHGWAGQTSTSQPDQET
jgi:ferredoxin